MAPWSRAKYVSGDDKRIGKSRTSKLDPSADLNPQLPTLAHRETDGKRDVCVV